MNASNLTPPPSQAYTPAQVNLTPADALQLQALMDIKQAIGKLEAKVESLESTLQQTKTENNQRIDSVKAKTDRIERLVWVVTGVLLVVGVVGYVLFKDLPATINAAKAYIEHKQ